VGFIAAALSDLGEERKDEVIEDESKQSDAVA
jgi:hypothetical protein